MKQNFPLLVSSQFQPKQRERISTNKQTDVHLLSERQRTERGETPTMSQHKREREGNKCVHSFPL